MNLRGGAMFTLEIGRKLMPIADADRVQIGDIVASDEFRRQDAGRMGCDPIE